MWKELDLKQHRWRVSLRFKIIALITAALTLSLTSYLYVGTSLVIEDKVSYIYDYNLARVKAAADSVESQVQKAMTTARVIASLSGDSTTSSSPSLVQQLFGEYSHSLGIAGLILMTPTAEGQHQLRLQLGDGSPETREIASQLGWTHQQFLKEKVLVGNVSADGKLPIGGMTHDAGHQDVEFVALIKLDSKLLESSKDFQLHVLDSAGNRILAKKDPSTELDPKSSRELEEALLRWSFGSGVRDAKIGGKDFVVGYQRMAYNKLTMVGYIPKEVAYAAAQALVNRSLALGVSVLSLALGLALVFARSLTARIRQVWDATKKVGEGDFSSRVTLKSGSHDEVTDLATGFNVMADKIDELMLQTAEKARLEKELETAQAVQKLFFPQKSFEDQAFKLVGKFVPASECAGDWWYYASRGNHLYVVIGDVTGHGVSAALLTATAHGAFSILTNSLNGEEDPRPALKSLVSHLNEAILAAAGGNATMTFLASVVNLKTGEMSIINASHTTPYVFRNRSAPEGTPLLKRFEPLIEAKGHALGHQAGLEIDPQTVKLHPGDLVFWYTDGLMECRNTDNQRISKTGLLKTLGALAETSESDPTKTCEGVWEAFMEHMAGASNSRSDDVTVLIGAVPNEAKLVAAKEVKGSGSGQPSAA